ncbi:MULTISPECIES: hypothetical protein [Comamonas]|uniref:hypothetical protein n=1 Tax=Comamonas TaxID=283 RepID=UPI0001DA68D7|nr:MULTISPECIES: hypothetical protein [Comamonas]EFI60753.1 hypothetical protein CTS44_15063 [Comamonas thiooxydans]TFF63119.1 hypothetical protein EIC84_03480 [Comamonas sp. A23]
MTVVVRVKDANWSGKGFRNLNPFVAAPDMEFGFDFMVRDNMLLDFASKHIVTPKRVDIKAGVLNETDPAIMVPVDSGLGIRLELGYLQCNLPLLPIPLDGSKKFTFLLVGRHSGVDFPPDKVVTAAPTRMIQLDWGSVVSTRGLSIDRNVSSGNAELRVAKGSHQMAVPPSSKLSANVVFVTFNGATWALRNMTTGVAITMTNAEMGLSGTEIPIQASAFEWTNGMLSIGGNANQQSTIYAAYPVLYQSAMWNRVLTADEMLDQYQRSKTSRPNIVV